MHILFITDTPSRGGAETHMLHLSRALITEGHKLSLLCTEKSRIQEMKSDFLDAGVNWHSIKAKGKHDPRLFWAILKFLKENPSSIPHFHLWNSASNRWGLLACHILGRKFCITEHYPLQLEGIKKQIRHFLIPQNTPCISVSQANQTFLKKAFGIESQVIWNGIQTSFMQKPQTKSTQKLLFLGELHERKGLRTLIKAIQTTESELAIYGKGPFQKEFEALAKDNPRIRFHGFTQNPESIWGEAALFILPSLEEPFGLVLLEATRAGLLCLASRVGGIPDIIEDGETGFLFEAGNEKDLADKIQAIQKLDSKEKERIILKAQAQAQDKFDIKSMLTKTIQFYKENF